MALRLEASNFEALENSNGDLPFGRQKSGNKYSRRLKAILMNPGPLSEIGKVFFCSTLRGRLSFGERSLRKKLNKTL